ncbi:MAG: triose-phosphate isomerase [Bacteroidetes bacterium GWF2_38_335]|nr:MAG: triose-phosphate isomerase [Bacteroidetes bacterium GWF2_38_335]OFY79919.1 MAG: triose-phosphate isomerase [Bacteroidetes bacterium RIFOXYA12_FULL_38_20]HBS86376.1 triose-phosphate isomerase [Bacteroidales bacterium]
MRQKIVAGNWKMNTTIPESIALAKGITEGKTGEGVKVVVAPPFTSLSDVNKIINGTGIELSAQNCSSEISGAYTGEVSCQMIKAVGAGYVIIGHSERRSMYHENDAIINKKVKIALTNGLTPIVCCGEVLSEREANNHFNVVDSQLQNGVFDLSPVDFSKIVIAYEPVWAIGTGVTASPAQAQEMHAFIRSIIEKKYGKQISDNTSILYGGSCKASNAKELFSQNDVDGGLIGGASLVAGEFISITNSF